MVNKELLRRTLEHIKANPEEHDQGSFMSPCGTTMCFAGWAAVLHTGNKPLAEDLREMEWRVNKHTGKFIDPVSGKYDDDDSVLVAQYAANILGLNYQQVSSLFFWAMSLSEVENVVNKILDSESE